MSEQIVVHQPLIREAAEALDQRIRRMACTIHGNIATIAKLVEEAKERQIHVALGFPSWTTYLASALGGQIVALPTKTRKELVCFLADEGASERAIATVTGAGKTTVHRDLEGERGGEEAGGPSGPPARPITGLDGKTYPRPASPRPDAKPRRKPITDAFWAATYDLGKLANRVQRLAADDRFAKNRNEIAIRNKSDLMRVQQTLAAVLAQLGVVDQADLFDGEA
jgi:hypothetical protein